MYEPYFANLFMPELVAGDLLPLMVQAAGEDTEQESLARHKGYPAYHALLSASGTGELKTSMGCFKAPPGHVFLLAPNQPHSYYPTSDRWHTCWVVFQGAEANEIVSRLKLTMGIPFELQAPEAFRRIYQKICACAQENSLDGIYRASAYCYELLAALSLESSNQSGCALPGVSREKIAPVLQYIHVHYSEDVSLEQMATCIGLSPQYLCKLFQAALAMSPCEYLQQYRLKKAKELLTEKSTTIKSAGSMCGFQDPSYFSAVFKRQVGYTPKEFRRIFGGTPKH